MAPHYARRSRSSCGDATVWMSLLPSTMTGTPILETKRSLIPLYALRTLIVYAQVYVAYCLLEQAFIAEGKLEVSDTVERTYYQGKIAEARYYTNNVLPQAFLATEMIRGADDTVITCPAEALTLR